MKKSILSPRIIFMLVILGLLAVSCGVEAPPDDDTGTPTITYHTLTIQNQSQFLLHHVFIYPTDLTYQDSDPCTENLAVDASFDISLEKGEYMATVTAKTTDGPLLAYTTAFPFHLTSDSLLEYFDSQYRFRSLESYSMEIEIEN